MEKVFLLQVDFICYYTPDIPIQRRPDQVEQKGDMGKNNADKKYPIWIQKNPLIDPIKAHSQKESTQIDTGPVFFCIEIQQYDWQEYTYQG